MEHVAGALGDQQPLCDHLSTDDLVGTQGRPRTNHGFPVRPDGAAVVDELVEPTRGRHVRGRDRDVHRRQLGQAVWPK